MSAAIMPLYSVQLWTSHLQSPMSTDIPSDTYIEPWMWVVKVSTKATRPAFFPVQQQLCTYHPEHACELLWFNGTCLVAYSTIGQPKAGTRRLCSCILLETSVMQRQLQPSHVVTNL